jgi:hypothetical protein
LLNADLEFPSQILLQHILRHLRHLRHNDPS